MTYARIDDVFPEHPKIVSLSDSAFRVHVSGICYSAKLLTDGFVPAGQAKLWNARAVRELVSARLWRTRAGGYEIHDFLDWNPSKSEVVRLKEARAAGGRARAQQVQSTSTSTSSADARAPAQQTLSTQAHAELSSPAPTPALESQDLPDAARLASLASGIGGDPDDPIPAGQTTNGFLEIRGLTNVQNSLVRKLREHDPRWDKLTPAGLNRLRNQHGSEALTLALQSLWEDRPEPKDPYALLKAVCATKGAEQAAVHAGEPA